MDLACDEQGERAHPRTLERGQRQKRRLRPQRFEVLDDGERLVEPRTVVELERWHQGLRVDRGVFRLTVLAFRQVHEHRLVGEPFEVEGNAYAERRRAAKVRVELQSAAAMRTFNSPTLSMPASSSSPGFTGPTPAGVPVKIRSPASSV